MVTTRSSIRSRSSWGMDRSVGVGWHVGNIYFFISLIQLHVVRRVLSEGCLYPEIHFEMVGYKIGNTVWFNEILGWFTCIVLTSFLTVVLVTFSIQLPSIGYEHHPSPEQKIYLQSFRLTEVPPYRRVVCISNPVSVTGTHTSRNIAFI